MRRRWIFTIAGAILLIAAVRIAVDAANRPSPSPVALPPIPGASGRAGDVQSKRHCDAVLSEGLRRSTLSLPRSQRRALPRTIAAVCAALPGGTRLEVAAQEVLTILRNRGR